MSSDDARTRPTVLSADRAVERTTAAESDIDIDHIKETDFLFFF